LISILANCGLLLAEAEAQPGGGGIFNVFSLTLWLPLIVLFYFMLIRPQRQEQQRRQAMLNNLKKNDRVLVAGGIYGVVTNVHREADEVTVKVDETTNAKLRVTQSAIVRVLGEETTTEAPKT